MSIEVRNLNFSYGSRQILFDISFSVEKGEFLSILGPNGVGKSTLFRCVLGLLSGYTGTVLVDGVDTRTFSVRWCEWYSSGVFAVKKRLTLSGECWGESVPDSSDRPGPGRE